MALADEIAKLAEKIKLCRVSIFTEEATKNAFVMPMLKSLGYDVFDPSMVIPEFTADVGIKKGEKVDYALRVNGKIAILVECKTLGTNLGDIYASQLFRYFSVTDARFGMLTNGEKYWFYFDLDNPNKMDNKPFFRFDIGSFRESQLIELEKFTHQNFDLDGIISRASTLKYMSLMIEQVKDELDSPSDELVKLLTKRIYDGNFSAAIKDKFTQIVLTSFREVIKDIVSQRLKEALRSTEEETKATDDEISTMLEPCEDIQTTEDELEAVRILKAIACEITSSSRIIIRDAKTYCAVLLDDNKRKPLVRLYFSDSQKQIGIFVNKVEEKFTLMGIEDIYKHSAKI